LGALVGASVGAWEGKRIVQGLSRSTDQITRVPVYPMVPTTDVNCPRQRLWSLYRIPRLDLSQHAASLAIKS
jgi:hypothetical protein